MGILKAVGLGSKIIFNGSKALVAGSVRTLDTAAQVMGELSKGNPRGATRAFGNYVGDGLVAGASTLNAADKLLTHASETENAGEFMTPENEKLIVKVATAGAVLVVGSSLLDSDTGDSNSTDEADADSAYASGDFFEFSSSDCPVHGSDCDAFFVGNEDDLQKLIDEGEISNSEHIDSDEIERSAAARQEFLNQHGLESVPEGSEVHHKVPLSEGGSDTPDNMVIVSEEDHDKITAAHRDFYKWNK